MKALPFKGSCTALVTPFSKDGSINYDVFAKLIECQIANGTDAIVICGTTGESSTLTNDERERLFSFGAECVHGRVPVIAGTGSNDTAHTVSLSKYAMGAGADALLVVTPYYNKASQNGLIKHFCAVADSTSLPVILYNVPSRTGVNIQTDTYKALSRHRNIVAVKEASGDISAIARLAAECKDELHIYSGNDDQTVPILALGGKGVVSVLSNIVPREMHDLCMLWFEGKTGEALELFLKLLDLMNSLFIDVNPIPVKAALKLMGHNVGGYRMPLTEMPESKLKILQSSMKALNLI
ncbi:MAG: 4-hydroxy-tetrahydrodipicolinate synthase [Firmicutes bacterium ADurb.Bin182]|nr:MAG: 4-hydroxy-tetrahydrodipicolinate synthase [Firmicutes bacterium ADurb.Bin182]